MRWFKHHSQLPRDEGISKMVDAAGRDSLAAYGFLMHVLEAVAEKMDGPGGKLDCTVTYSIRQWGRITNSHTNRVKKMMSLCDKVDWVCVDVSDGMCRVTVSRMLEWRDEYTRKSGHAQDRVAENRPDQSKIEKIESRADGSPSLSSLHVEGSRIPPADFEITPDLRQWAVAEVPEIDIEAETKAFLSHEFPTPKSDWPCAWKKFMLNARPGCHVDPRRTPNETMDSAAKLFGIVRQDCESKADWERRVTNAVVRKDYG